MAALTRFLYQCHFFRLYSFCVAVQTIWFGFDRRLVANCLLLLLAISIDKMASAYSSGWRMYATNIATTIIIIITQQNAQRKRVEIKREGKAEEVVQNVDEIRLKRTTNSKRK